MTGMFLGISVLCKNQELKTKRRMECPAGYYWLFLYVVGFFNTNAGQKYDLTGSSRYAALGKNFTWTCNTSNVSNEQDRKGVTFYRNSEEVALILFETSCIQVNPPFNDKYQGGCKSDTLYTLHILGSSMDVSQQGTEWFCEYVGGQIRSSTVVLQIAIGVRNVSLFPSGNTLPIIMGNQVQVTCTVNKDAVPPPNITWYLGFDEKFSDIHTRESSINITGAKEDDKKTLECRASNSDGQPETVTTTLNVEFPPAVSSLNQQSVIEGMHLKVTCNVSSGNPSPTLVFWTKVNDETFSKQNGTTLQLSNINRNNSGTYRCTAENTYSNGQKGTHSQDMIVNVLYPPAVTSLNQQSVIEGMHLKVTCNVSSGNPSPTLVFWTKVNDETFSKQNGTTLQLSKINRNNSGTYRCTAENTYSNGQKGTHSQDMIVNVLYPPTVLRMSQQNVTEGTHFQIICNATPGNPTPISIVWTKEENTMFILKEPILQLSYINRTNSGTYRCTAENDYGNGKKGTHSQDMVVNVLYKPEIKIKNRTIANETERVVLIREVDSNPLANITWYDGKKYLKSQTAVKTANLTIENASCEDSKNFTLEAKNILEIKVTAMVELIVNCKPRAVKPNITLGVTDDTGIKFSSTVIAYPEPKYELKYENGTMNNKMKSNLIRNFVNNFTVQFIQTDVRQTDYGTYHLQLNNSYGGTTVFVTVIPQRRPDVPKHSRVTCKVTSADLNWRSSFDGGDPQKFTAHAFIGQKEISQSKPVDDAGENKIHYTIVQNLQPSTMYIFYIHAKNKHGISSSDNTSCVTLAKEDQNSLPVIAAGAGVGGIALAVIVIAAVFFLRRFKLHKKKVGKSQRLTNDECTKEDPDDGLKENILYVSAGPRNNNESEGAVYAAVTKKPLEDNANVYADVKKDGKKAKTEADIYSDVKPKKGLFKKDGKQKPKNGKKQRGKQVAADVYENSEDIAMTSNADNVYSNTNCNAKNDQEQRGYKNKDGLLYVDVQFDAKKGKENPVIHGEDEKTDYATVEFPMPPLSQEDASAEKY